MRDLPPLSSPDLKIAIVGLGYVGLPVAVRFAEAGYTVVGLDKNEARIADLQSGEDKTASVDASRLTNERLSVTATAVDIKGCQVVIVAVPTPVDRAKRPDMGALLSAARSVGEVLTPGTVVVFESTVYPGATEEVVVPVLEAVSGLKMGSDFAVGYSPERINPGDPDRDFKDIIKIVAGSDPVTAAWLCDLYGSVVEAGIHPAPSIKVAEAAKVIENTQRDLNIALMNELAILFHDLGIDTRDVLAGAGTKWNFLPFQPGLVGGHCIGVDPYYLTHKAHEVGMTPQVILAGRGTNEMMPSYVAGKIIQSCVRLGRPLPLKIAILGITYKANVPDIRNSKVADLIAELSEFGAEVLVHDPLADQAEVKAEYGLECASLEALCGADAYVLAVPHKAFLEDGGWPLLQRLSQGASCLVADLPARLDRDATPDNVTLWRL